MNPFATWKLGDVYAHNERVKMKDRYTAALAAPPKRIRQGEPKVRPWEQEWENILNENGAWVHVKAQSFRVRLANGAWYKPDVSAVRFGMQRLHCWEVKGGKKMKGVAKGILALKVAASQYPEIVWTLCWKENGAWKQQQVQS